MTGGTGVGNITGICVGVDRTAGTSVEVAGISVTFGVVTVGGLAVAETDASSIPPVPEHPANSTINKIPTPAKARECRAINI